MLIIGTPKFKMEILLKIYHVIFLTERVTQGSLHETLVMSDNWAIWNFKLKMTTLNSLVEHIHIYQPTDYIQNQT